MSFEYGIILGGAPLNAGVVSVLRSWGLHVVVVDFRGKINLDCDTHIVHDAKSVSVVDVLIKKGISAVQMVYTSMDEAGLAQRALCKHFGLRYVEEEAIFNAHNKAGMHTKWRADGILNRESMSFKKFDSFRIMQLNNRCPVIIKPVDSCASRGITVLPQNVSMGELKDAFECAQGATISKQVNVEEFVVGTEFCAEMLGDDYGNISVFGIAQKYHSATVSRNSRIAIKLLYNSLNISGKTFEAIAAYAILCYRSVGLKNTFGHLEIIMKEDGTFSPVEIGARSSGFIASHLVDAACDQSYLGAFRNVLHGGKTTNGLMPFGNNASMYFFYDMPSGMICRKKGSLLDYLDSRITSAYSDNHCLSPDITFKRLTQDNDRYGCEVLIGPRDVLTIEHVEKAEAVLLKEICS